MPNPEEKGLHKVLGFDYGTHHIGIAVGQTMTKTAEPLGSLGAQEKYIWVAIKKLIEDWQPDTLVVGLPLNMDGTKQTFTYQTEQFAKKLAKCFDLPVYMVDERLTTRAAKAHFLENNQSKLIHRKSKVDAMSAKLIVEHWLTSPIFQPSVPQKEG